MLHEFIEIETLPKYNGRVKPTIYVVEDDPDISRLVRHHLEGAGFSVRLYSTGNLVVVDAERQRPALFLLDIMVPGKDGLELCRQIRQSPALASVPVIFLTAKSGEADRVLGWSWARTTTFPSLSARVNWWPG
jgi:DNA-binding response OmpR family regulator